MRETGRYGARQGPIIKRFAVAALPFFLCSLAWNYGLGMTWLAVPLYALAQGLPNAQIGVLFSLPVLAQIPFNLAGGAYSDRVGGRRILLASCCAMAAAGVWFAFSEGFWMLLAGQIVLVLSRAAFWPATWSIASELPGVRGVQLGRLNAVTNLGQIAGTVTSGFVLAGAGHVPAFLALALLGAVAFAAALRTTEARGKHAEPSASLFASYRPLLERRITYYTLLCAYLSALPFSLSVSFYPLLLEHFGFGERASGILVALRAVGAIGAGLLVGRYVRTGADSLWPVVCGVSVAAAVGLIPLANHFAPIALWMLVVGVGSGAMTLYFQLTISEASRTQERGAALALGGLGWAVSNLTTPLGMGLLADRYGIEAGFYVLGCFALAFTAAAALLRRWAFAGPASAPRARS